MPSIVAVALTIFSLLGCPERVDRIVRVEATTLAKSAEAKSKEPKEAIDGLIEALLQVWAPPGSRVKEQAGDVSRSVANAQFKAAQGTLVESMNPTFTVRQDDDTTRIEVLSDVQYRSPIREICFVGATPTDLTMSIATSCDLSVMATVSRDGYVNCNWNYVWWGYKFGKEVVTHDVDAPPATTDGAVTPLRRSPVLDDLFEILTETGGWSWNGDVTFLVEHAVSKRESRISLRSIIQHESLPIALVVESPVTHGAGFSDGDGPVIRRELTCHVGQNFVVAEVLLGDGASVPENAALSFEDESTDRLTLFATGSAGREALVSLRLSENRDP